MFHFTQIVTRPPTQQEFTQWKSNSVMSGSNRQERIRGMPSYMKVGETTRVDRDRGSVVTQVRMVKIEGEEEQEKGLIGKTRRAIGGLISKIISKVKGGKQEEE